MRQFPLFALFRFLLLFFMTSVLAEPVTPNISIGDFSRSSLQQWESRSFKDETQYRLDMVDGVPALRAESAGTASGLFKKQRVDLSKTPFLHWRWRIENRLGPLNEQSKAGDDFVARIYVVIEGGLAFWRSKAFNYVWASTSPKGKIWPNAFAGDSVMMIALRSANDKTAIWYDEQRNVRADLRQQFGEDFRYIDAIAVMTDTDNAGGKAVAYYGDLYFSAD